MDVVTAVAQEPECCKEGASGGHEVHGAEPLESAREEPHALPADAVQCLSLGLCSCCSGLGRGG